ncbi:MAG: cupin domain-containing protein, partial [Planctomycetota bacterium]|nr:cupin domain-containing protein [Planctomycetota bacterium]
KQLETTALALGLIKIPAGMGYTFTHKHREQEEVYIVMEGKGQLLIDGELHDLCRGDIFRVAPEARRAVKADDDESLFVICAGAVPGDYPKEENARYLIDDGVPFFDDVPPWYEGDPEVIAKNKKLRERVEKSKAKKAKKNQS